MDLFAIVGIALTAAALCILLKQYKPEYAMLVSLVCGILIFLVVIQNLKPAFDVMNQLMGSVNVSGEYGKAIIKALGICYITQLASDSCKDAGQTAIGSKVEMAGKVAVVLLALPLFQNIVSVAMGLVGMGQQ